MRPVTAKTKTQNRAVIEIDPRDEFARTHAQVLGYATYPGFDARGVLSVIWIFTTPQRAREFVQYCE